MPTKKSTRRSKTKDQKEQVEPEKDVEPDKKEERKEEPIEDKEIKKESIWWILFKFFSPFAIAFVFTFLLLEAFPEQKSDFAEVFVFTYFNPAGIEVGVFWAIANKSYIIFATALNGWVPR